MKSAYLDTVFDVDHQAQLPQEFVIITAYNPRGRAAPPSRNQHQDQTLRAVLINRGATPLRVTGRNVDGSHQEPGWAVALSVQVGLEIGRMFKQEAIYSVSHDELTLHACTHEQTDPVGSWNARVIKSETQ